MTTISCEQVFGGIAPSQDKAKKGINYGATGRGIGFTEL